MSRTESLAELFSKVIKSTLEEEINKAETEEEAKKFWIISSPWILKNCLMI